MLTDRPNIIVTGGCGFIGSHLTKRLLDQGFAVTVVDDNRTGKVFWKKYGKSGHSNITLPK